MLFRKLTILVAALVTYSVGEPSLAAPQAAAKLPNTPLLVAVREGQGFVGNIWAWRGSALIRRTNSGLCFVPVVSPAGDWYAYQQIPTA
jgi:hypothetical protein